MEKAATLLGILLAIFVLKVVMTDSTFDECKNRLRDPARIDIVQSKSKTISKSPLAKKQYASNRGHIHSETLSPATSDIVFAQHLQSEDRSNGSATSNTGISRSLDEFIDKIATSKLTTAANTINWSLNDAINAALFYSHQIDTLRIESKESLQEVGIQLGAFDTVSFFEANFSDSNQPVVNDFESDGTNQRTRSEEFSFNYGLRKTLPRGGELEISDRIITRDDNSGVLTPPMQARSTLGLRWSKELLQGSGLSIAANEIVVARLNAKSQNYDSTAQIVDLIQDVSDAFWEIYAARGALVSAVDSVQVANSILIYLLARTSIDADPNLVEQARVVKKQREVLADEAFTELTQAQFSLVRLVNAPELLQNEERIEFIPIIDSGVTSVNPDVASRQNTAIHNRPEIKSVLTDIRRAQMEYHLSINQLLPQLTFNSEANFEGLAGDRDVAAAGRDRFDSDASYQVGFDFEMSIGNRQARFRRKQLELEIQRLNSQWKDSVEQVKFDVLDAAIEFRLGNKILIRQQEIFKSSLERLKFLELRQSNVPIEGAIPSLQLGQLLDVQTDVASAQADYVASIADRGRSIINLNRATGILVKTIPSNLTDPGSHRFVQVYLQLFEDWRHKQSQTQDLISAVRQVSKKHFSETWLGDKKGHQACEKPTVHSGVDDERLKGKVNRYPLYPDSLQ